MPKPTRPPPTPGETPVRFHDRILTGHFNEGPDYRNYRSLGSPDWLLILTLTGSGRLGYPNDSGNFTTQPGDLTLYLPNAFHNYATHLHPTPPLKPHWELQWAHFHPRAHWLDFLNWPQLAPGLRHVRLRDSDLPDVSALMSRMHRHASSGDVLGKELALAVLEQVIILGARSTPRRTMDERITHAMRHLAAHHQDPLDIPALADSVHLSPSRFAHLFREQTGITPLQFLERQRIDAAIRLLSVTSKSVKEIAAESGFTSPFYFSLRFKKATGKSPSQYRGGE
jgi:AraC family transcriptional regulator of arabinose operon